MGTAPHSCPAACSCSQRPPSPASVCPGAERRPRKKSPESCWSLRNRQRVLRSRVRQPARSQPRCGAGGRAVLGVNGRPNALDRRGDMTQARMANPALDVGSHVLDEAAGTGHDVTAVVRDRKKPLPGGPGYRDASVVCADLAAPNLGVEASTQPSPDWSQVLQHRRDRSGALRAGVFGLSDGLVSNTALVMGLAGSGSAHRAILLAGIAGLLAGSLSMAAGEYVSMASQREMYEREISLVAHELEERPNQKTRRAGPALSGQGPRARRRGARRRPDHDRPASGARDARPRGAGT